ncbi:MAG TPA: sigma-70 family RNA polymerase sigma factor [Candidatus Anammoximicrobium sp.]|nr:sigma-70 family RNA polymerase sigma factor [Candidatus Anammoximicrobium sp.]
MAQDPSPTELLQRYRQGDPDAASVLFARYAQRLYRLAEQQLSRRLVKRTDGDDIVQSAFRTFFLRLARGEFQIDNRVQLWHLLAKITVRKAREQARRHMAEARDVDAEQPGSPDDWLLQAATSEPGPEEVVILMDQIESLLRGLPDLYGQILESRLQGYSVAEIAGQLGVSRQNVYRALEVLQHRLA